MVVKHSYTQQLKMIIDRLKTRENLYQSSPEATQPVSNEEFNPDFIGAIHLLLSFFVTELERKGMSDLAKKINKGLLAKRFFSVYRKLVPLDYKILFNKTLKEVRQSSAEEIVILVSNNHYKQRSTTAFGKAFYDYYLQSGGNKEIQVFDWDFQASTIKSLLRKPNTMFVLIDDATHTGTQALSNIQHFLWACENTTQTHLLYSFAYTESRELQDNLLLQAAKHQPNSVSVQIETNFPLAIEYPDHSLYLFISFLQGLNPDETLKHSSGKVKPFLVDTGFKYPDDHSVPLFLSEIGSYTGNGSIKKANVQRYITFLKKELQINRVLIPWQKNNTRKTKYPSPEEIITIIKSS